VIVSCAAYTAVDRAETDQAAAHAANAVGPGVLAEEAKRCGALLVHFSTDYVFDGEKRAPYVETDATNPLSVYGATKLAGERAIVAAGANHVILRTSWVYGPHGKNFLFTMLRLGRERDELRVVDDQRGAPTSSRALARLVRELLQPGGDVITRDRVDDGRIVAGSLHGATTWSVAQAISARCSARPSRLHAAAVDRDPDERLSHARAPSRQLGALGRACAPRANAIPTGARGSPERSQRCRRAKHTAGRSPRA
jgi:dTDP-4-dehydrorhamnose reductase